jgi:hypothetical protein
MKNASARPWLTAMTSVNFLLNAILAITHRRLYLAGYEATDQLMHPENLDIEIQTHENVQLWNSVFSGLAVISNRISPRHRDSGGCPSWYDLLLSAGTHTSAFLELNDIGTRLSYKPGTVDLICGKILSHSLSKWGGGERICIAAFMREVVHDRLDVYDPNWCFRGSYAHLMNEKFAVEQRWRRGEKVHSHGQ